MDHPKTPPNPERPEERERRVDRYETPYDDAYPEGGVVPGAERLPADAAPSPPGDDEIDPADRTAFRIGANLLTLLVLVLGGWWLWRHVLAPALLGSP